MPDRPEPPEHTWVKRGLEPRYPYGPRRDDRPAVPPCRAGRGRGWRVIQPEPEIPEDEDVIQRCDDPCPEAPDLDPCLLPRGHAYPWHRNRSSSWPVPGDGGGA